ncbi:hypothetical protein CsSME_00051781 [Camellia sinensis var. sinensis]
MKSCPAPCLTFHRKERVELMYLLDPSGLTGLEPAASALTGRCSDQLNYNPREIRDIAENWILFYSPYQVFLKDKGLYHLMVDWRIIYWAELDLNQRRHIANEFTVRPINRSGIDPGRIHFRLIGNP